MEGGAAADLDYLDADDVSPRRCTVYLKTVQGVALKYLLEVMKDLLRANAHFQFGPEGILLCQMDSSMTALVQVRLHASEFEEYHCAPPEDGRDGRCLVVDAATVARALKGTRPQDTVFMFVRRDKPDMMCCFRFDSVARRLSKTAVPLLNEEPNGKVVMQELDFSCAFTVPSELLQTVCKDLDSGDSNKIVHVKVGRAAGEAWRVSLRCSGPGSAVDQQQDLDENNDERGLMWIDRPTRQFSHPYRLKFLLMFCKAQPISRMLEMRLANLADKSNGLIWMEYRVAAMGSLVFMLSNSILDDDL